MKIWNWVLAALAGAPLGISAASLSISPSAVTNDYSGTIGLDITGLGSAREVVVEKFADLNTNGIVDPGEPMMLSFTVTDGQLPLIGGVRNLNVPGDEDGAVNGQMRVELFYPGVDTTLDHFEGNYLYRISSSASAFAPVTQPFAVRQKPFPQGIRGRVTDVGTGSALSKATIILLDGMGMSVGGTTINSNGYFTLLAPAGDYILWAMVDGYVGDMGQTMGTVSPNQFLTNNITLVAGNHFVGGRVSDASNGIGLPGIVVLAESPNNRYALTFTDSNGNFLLKLVSDQWKIYCNESQLPLLGYVGAQGGFETNLTGNLSGLNLQVTKANALIYGTVTDDQARAMPGASLRANDHGGQFEADGIAYPTNGAYCLGILAGNWQAEPDSDWLAGQGLLSQGTKVTVASGQAVRADFILKKYTAHLQGRVLDSMNNPVASIALGASDSKGAWSGTQTDDAGYFDIGVYAGQWSVQLSTEDAVQRGFVSASLPVTVADGETRSNLVLRVQRVTAMITGTVLNDHGQPLAQLGVWASSTVNGTNSFNYTETDGSGNYQLGVFNASWTVGLDCSGPTGLTARSYQCPNSLATTVSGANKTLNFTVLQVPAPLSAKLESPRLLSDGSFVVGVSGTPGHSFDVYASGDLATKWDWLLSTNNPPGGTFQVVDPNPTGGGSRFFRVRIY
jgi:hypothetical protein